MINPSLWNLTIVVLLAAAAIIFYRGIGSPRMSDRIALAAALVAAVGSDLYYCIERACLPGGKYIAVCCLLVALFCLLLPPARAKAPESYTHRAASAIVCLIAGIFSWYAPVWV